jgi:hypothetical protein
MAKVDTAIDLERDIFKRAREVLRRANEGDDFAEETLLCLINTITLLIHHARRDPETGDVVEALARFAAECQTPVLN